MFVYDYGSLFVENNSVEACHFSVLAKCLRVITNLGTHRKSGLGGLMSLLAAVIFLSKCHGALRIISMELNKGTSVYLCL